jgi:hypothetical protein
MSEPLDPPTVTPPDDTTDLPTVAQPPQPDTSYRSLASLNLVNDPKLMAIVSQKARPVIDSVKSWLVTPEDVRNVPISAQFKKKRKRAETIYNKLEAVKGDHSILNKHLGSIPVTPASNKKVKPKDKVTLKAIKEKVPKLILGEDGESARPFGYQRGLLTLEPDSVQAIPPGVKIGDQVKQYLGHVSELFFAKVKGMEVECMLVNDRVLVSVNDQELVQELADQTLSELLQDAAKLVPSAEDHLRRQRQIGLMSEAFSTVPDDEEPTAIQKEGAAKLAEAEVGYHMDYESREGLGSFLETLRHQAQNALRVQGPYTIDVAATKITEPTCKNAIIAVGTLGGDSHAEQHLALALIKSSHGGKATIAGTKNPCAVCWLTLALVQQAGWALDFNNKPGALWGTTYRGLVAVAKQLNIKDITALWARFVRTADLLPEGEFGQFVVSLRERAELTVVVPRSGGGLVADGLTQDISQLSQEMVDDDDSTYLGNLTEPPATPPPGGYGTPQQSQDDDEDI